MAWAFFDAVCFPLLFPMTCKLPMAIERKLKKKNRFRQGSAQHPPDFDSVCHSKFLLEIFVRFVILLDDGNFVFKVSNLTGRE
jgi:hypothetical protein